MISDFPPIEIHEHLVLPLSSITFTAKSQADNHFYKYIYLFLLFQLLYSNGLQKKLKMVYTVYFKWSTEKKSHAICVDNTKGVIISTKRVNKNLNILKKEFF